MGFFKKTFRSILGLSNPGCQSTPRRRNFPSLEGELTVISTTGDIDAPANVLDSVAIKLTVMSGESIPNDGKGDSRPNEVTGKAPAIGAAFFQSAAADGHWSHIVDRFATWTEHLGLESSSEKVKGSNLSEESPPPAGSRSRSTMWRARREKVALKNFPPLLSTLNKNGRPRFILKKVRKDGRLQIAKVPNDWPGIVRTPRGDGGLKIQFIDADQDNKGDEEERREGREDVGGDREATVAKGGGCERGSSGQGLLRLLASK